MGERLPLRRTAEFRESRPASEPEEESVRVRVSSVVPSARPSPRGEARRGEAQQEARRAEEKRRKAEEKVRTQQQTALSAALQLTTWVQHVLADACEAGVGEELLVEAEAALAKLESEVETAKQDMIDAQTPTSNTS